MFKRKAAEQIGLLSSSPFVVESGSGLESFLNRNDEKPRKGAFEIVVETESGEKGAVWSGLKLGPPRKLKFPEPDQLMSQVQKFLADRKI